MKVLAIFVLSIFAVVLVLPAAFPGKAEAQLAVATEAPTGFDDLSNGFSDQATFNADKEQFDEVDGTDEGLGPIYNAQSCRECHQNTVSGAISQVTELRAGHLDNFGNFIDATVSIDNGAVTLVRSLINDRAICPNALFPDNQAQERVPDRENIRTFRTSLNILGDGFVEAIADRTLLGIAEDQCLHARFVFGSHGEGPCGQAIFVPVAESPGHTRVGRFGWKDQVASLLTFSGDAYLNEMGISNSVGGTPPLYTDGPFSHDVTTVCKTTTDPENVPDSTGVADTDRFARFMRALKAPARDAQLAATPEAQAGAHIFKQIGCAVCHVPSVTTAAPGTVINGGALTVSPALGNKIIHPFGDFLLHNVGTGDGIVQNGGQSTRNKVRTAPLWGVRTRSRLMHDGESFTFTEAILRHRGEAEGVTEGFRNLTNAQKKQLLAFLRSL